MATTSVTIVLPHGRRFTIKVTPNTSIQQILEDACKKAGLKPEETDLVHQRKVLDTGLTVRFANIPNNVSLELQPVKNGPKIQKLVTIGLQLESGERLLHDFPSSSTVWDVIQHWSQTKGEILKGEANAEPVCIYMRNEIIGENDLKKTTLNSLGITSGRVMIRLVYRVPSSLKEQAYVEDLNLKKTAEIDAWGIVDNDIKQSKSQEANVLSQNPPRKTIEEIPPIIEASSNVSGNEKLELTEGKEIEEPPPIKTDDEMETESALTSQEIEMEDGEVDEEMEDIPEQEERLIYIGDNEALLFNMDEVPALPKIDLPEQFFEHTERDIRYLYSDIKKQLQELEEKPLMLSSQIAQMKENKALRYKNSIVRVHFPNRLVLQAKFDPRDKVLSVKEFVRQFLIEPDLDFYLYTTPPKNILNEEMSLFEGDLVPAALIHFGCHQKENTTEFLKEDVRSNVSTLRAATKKAKTLRCEQEGGIISEPLPSTSGVATITTQTLRRDQKGLDNVNKSRPVTKNPPKWFKLGTK